MKAISHMSFVQSAYPAVERASTELQSLVQKITSCMPAYFSNYSKARALDIFTISLAAFYALYAYAKSHKSDKPSELSEKPVKRLPVEAQPSSTDSDSDMSGDWESILPKDLYLQVKDANTLVRARSITPPSSPLLPSKEAFGENVVDTSTPARTKKPSFSNPEFSQLSFAKDIIGTSTPALPNKGCRYRPVSSSPPQSPVAIRLFR